MGYLWSVIPVELVFQSAHYSLPVDDVGIERKYLENNKKPTQMYTVSFLLTATTPV